MKWVTIKPYITIPKAQAEKWPVVDHWTSMSAEIGHTVVRDPVGHHWYYGDWVSDELAYRVEERKA